MAKTAERERQMNLAALQQRDPYITTIKDSATQVAVYIFNAGQNEWEKTEIEGTLFVYVRSAFPIYGYMIINRLGLRDLIQPINQKLEFQLQDPFLLYRTEKGSIYGIWFYDKDECARLGQLMNSLVKMTVDTHPREEVSIAPVSCSQPRSASESDPVLDLLPSNTAGCPANGTAAMTGKNVDILQMLSKAQDEYDKATGNVIKIPLHGPQSSSIQQVKQPSLVASKRVKTGITPPEHVKGKGSVTAKSGPVAHGTDSPAELPSTTINLDALFKRASLHYDNDTTNDISAFRSQAPQIMTSRQNASTVEEIERCQIATKNSVRSSSGADICAANLGHGEPESPNTLLRRTLRLVPPPVKVDSRSQSKTSHHSPSANYSPSFVEMQAGSLPLFRTVSSDRVSEGSSDIIMFSGSRSSQERMQPTAASSLSPDCLITPQALLQTCNTTKTDATSVLMSPMAFQAAASTNDRHLSTNKFLAGDGAESGTLSSCGDSRFSINPLTKEQLQQSLIHLLQNDTGFICAIHAAYVDSLNQGLGSRGNGHL